MGLDHSLTQALSGAGNIVRTAFADAQDPQALNALAQELQPADLDLVILFISPAGDAQAIAGQAETVFAPATVIGCTTAGELSPGGYSEGEIVAIGLPRSHFRSRLLSVPDLSDYDNRDLTDQLIRNRNALAREQDGWPSEFCFLLIDGLSLREDTLTADLTPGLGPVPLFGGSAGDGTDFQQTFVLCDGTARSHAAVLVQIRTSCPIRVFKTDHLIPTDDRMVVTGADPARRVVHEINAEPAAREYARLLGKDPEQLTTFTFAAHPVVVRIGGQHHVRAIQRVADNGDLVFFSAIDEGVVLTLADARDLADHLGEEMTALTDRGRPDIVLACDCVLRRLEAQQKQKTGEVSRLLAKHRVIGFSTYGEQVNSMHVNQTMTGVAIYPPDAD